MSVEFVDCGVAVGDKAENRGLAPELLDDAVPVPDVPEQVAVAAEADARDLDEAELDPAQPPIDIFELHTHDLGDGETVRLHIAAFAILSYIDRQAKTEGYDGWFRPPGKKIGILRSLADRIGDDLPAVKTLMELCVDQGLVEVVSIETKSGPLVTNARTTEKGEHAFTELNEHYRPLLQHINLNSVHDTINRMVDEMAWMAEILGDELDGDIIALKNRVNVDEDDLPSVLARLDKKMHALEYRVDTYQSQPGRTGWADVLARAITED